MLLDVVMGKDDPIEAWLRCRNMDKVDLGFADTERILSGILPNAASDPAWWAAHAGVNTVQVAAWRAAGFEARPDVRNDRVFFIRTRVAPRAPVVDPALASAGRGHE